MLHAFENISNPYRNPREIMFSQALFERGSFIRFCPRIFEL